MRRTCFIVEGEISADRKSEGKKRGGREMIADSRQSTQRFLYSVG